MAGAEWCASGLSCFIPMVRQPRINYMAEPIEYVVYIHIYNIYIYIFIVIYIYIHIRVSIYMFVCL